MSNTNLSDLATQKLQQIHNLVLQFQALENDLRDTFQAIEGNYQNEIKKLQKEINQLKGVSDEEINRNNFFGASQLEANPLSPQQKAANSYNQQSQQRQANGSIVFNQPPPPINPSPNNNYSSYTQQQQPHTNINNMNNTASPHQSIALRNQNSGHSHSHWKATTPMSYQQKQNQNQNANGYSQQQNSYHSKQNRSTGNPVPPPPNQQKPQKPPQYGQYGGNKSLPTSKHNDDIKKQERASNPNPIASLMNKFQQKTACADKNNISGLSVGISERDFYKKYWIEAGKIGEGAFARVRKITRKSDKAVFALKMIKKKGKSAEDIIALQREILVLQKCDHVNIVRLGDWCDTKKRIYMVVEFCDGGDVFERVVEYKKFNEKSAIHVVAQVASGIGHVHSLGYLHRDLKPDNLMYLTKAVDSEIKIIDFGLAGDCNNNGVCKTPCGTAHYAAPEVLSSIEYNMSADMWSLGVIIYTLLCGFPPFFDASNNMKNLYHLIKKGQYSFPSPFWDDISENAKDLIKKLLVKDPSGRLNAQQVLKHPWIANAKNAPEKDLGNQYVKQMSHWQSTRQATEFGLGQEAPPPPPPDQPINLYYNPNQKD